MLLSLVALHKIFSSVFVAYTKDLYNFFDVYSFFFLFFKLKVSSFMLVDLAVLVNNFQNILVARNMGFSFIKSVKTEGFNTLLSS